MYSSMASKYKKGRKRRVRSPDILEKRAQKKRVEVAFYPGVRLGRFLPPKNEPTRSLLQGPGGALDSFDLLREQRADYPPVPASLLTTIDRMKHYAP